VTAEQHMVAFEQLTDLLQIIHEDVFTRTFSQSLHGDVGQWFRHLEANSIGSWTEFHDVFMKYCGENKSFDQYLTDFYALRKEDDETIVQFNRRFHSIYHSMLIEIQLDPVRILGEKTKSSPKGKCAAHVVIGAANSNSLTNLSYGKASSYQERFECYPRS
jgi:hypothetical protein